MAFVAHRVSKHELPAIFAVISARLDSHILSLAGTIDFRALAVHQALTAEPLAPQCRDLQAFTELLHRAPTTLQDPARTCLGDVTLFAPIALDRAALLSK